MPFFESSQERLKIRGLDFKRPKVQNLPMRRDFGSLHEVNGVFGECREPTRGVDILKIFLSE